MAAMRIIQLTGSKLAYTPEVWANADLAIDADGIVFKARHGEVGRPATRTELKAATPVEPPTRVEG